jgi:hypothetical protein
MGFPNAFCFCNFAILQFCNLGIEQCVAYKEKKRPGVVGTPGRG